MPRGARYVGLVKEACSNEFHFKTFSDLINKLFRVKIIFRGDLVSFYAYSEVFCHMSIIYSLLAGEFKCLYKEHERLTVI